MDEELEEMEQRPVARRRVVESRPGRGGLSLGTQFMLILGITLVAGVSIMIWVSQRTISPTIKHVTDALGSYGWLWMLLLIVTAIGAAIGLLRRFGFMKFIEDMIVLGLRVHRHFVDAGRLKADKGGNYELLIGKDGLPIYIQPGNPAYAPQAPMIPSMGIGGAARRAKAQVTQINEIEQAAFQQKQLAGNTPYLLNAPTALQQDVINVKPSDVETVPLGDIQTWGDAWARNEVRAYIKKEVPGQYDFLEEIEHFQPSPQAIFMARSADGPITVPFVKHGHITFAGPSRVGKSTIMRMLMAQFIAINVDCYMCDSHYIPFNPDNGLDWEPIEARLAHAPFRKANEAADFLRWLALEELATRKELAYHKKPVGRPIVVAIDELAGLIDEAPEVARYIGLLLRQSLKYWIVLAISAQDLLMKSIGLDSGMIENILAGYYGGGDLRTAKIALDLQNGEHTLIDENGLGKGVVYFRAPGYRAVRVRIPWPDNESVQMLCDLSSLPVHELVREPLATTIQEDRVYSSLMGQSEQPPTNIRDFPVPASKVGKTPDAIKHEHFTYAVQNLQVSDANMAKILDITQFQANKIKNVFKFVMQHPEMNTSEIGKEKSILEQDAVFVKSLVSVDEKASSVNE